MKNFLEPKNISDIPFREGQHVTGIVGNFTPLGAKVKLNYDYEGLLYKDEVYKELKKGDEIQLYVKKIREDGKIDLSLNKAGYKGFIGNTTNVVLDKLKKSGGFLPFNDDSSPEEIYKTFNMSKKKFKETIGALYKRRKIIIDEDGIELV